ncbi:phosphoglucan phosphatase DSP4 chloroplastic-like, partial [Trifolium medium]|nr:phosphoglucan phosphatase DSP4 chloroplastic-like [Trifolium medium]
VIDDADGDRASLRDRVTGDDPDLTKDERIKIIEFLEAFPDEDL